MLSGECRIDAIPVNGQAVLIDGLRLRLDLRLAPSARAAKGSHQQPWTGSALLPGGIQRQAAMAGLGALLTALVFWFAGGTPAPTSIGGGAPPLAAPARPAAAPVALPPAVPSAAVPPAAVPPAARAPVSPPADEMAGPRVAPVTPELRPIVEPRARLESPLASADKPTLAVAKSPAAPRASAARPPASSAPAGRPRATDREMLDLFGDTK